MCVGARGWLASGIFIDCCSLFTEVGTLSEPRMGLFQQFRQQVCPWICLLLLSAEITGDPQPWLSHACRRLLMFAQWEHLHWRSLQSPYPSSVCTNAPCHRSGGQRTPFRSWFCQRLSALLPAEPCLPLLPGSPEVSGLALPCCSTAMFSPVRGMPTWNQLAFQTSGMEMLTDCMWVVLWKAPDIL